MSCSSARQAEMISRNTPTALSGRQAVAIAGPGALRRHAAQDFAFPLGTVRGRPALQLADLAHQRRTAVELREQLRVHRVDFQPQLADFPVAHASAGR